MNGYDEDRFDERQMLQQSARRFVEREYGFAQRKAVLTEPNGFSRAHWRTFAELGWLALALPPACGGLGDDLDQALLAEELGRALAVEPWLANAALCAPLLAACGAVRHAALAERISAGGLMAALAAFETQGRHDAFDVATRARRGDDAHWRIDGTKTLVLGGGCADVLLVLARTDGERRDTHGLTLFAVPAATPGMAVEAHPTYDDRQTATVTLRRVTLSDEARIGEVGDAWPVVQAAIDRATVMACAEAVGTMARAFELTREYAVTRRQFGRSLSANQVIRHRLVDLYVSIEQARSITEAAAAALRADDVTRMRAVSYAKAFVSGAGRALGEDAVQLHGAIGMTDEMEVGHCYKRLAAHANLFGDADWHLARLDALE
ncbi:acyl-CoA dehydrogenase family protein [Burkholderia guangdongensis]|uniref:acyl-CoA dehydrogenase family protein n=1 Tax=Burkholderia guangdongensis TaxID=1792500 RepID=UPI001FEAA239|nr:acyl-CoA dehydrogenase [Burkholderia guangdongensis]